MTRTSGRAPLVLLSCALLVACGEHARGAPPPPPSIGFQADDAAANAAGPSVFLRSRSSATAVILDVVARGAADLHGAAFRLAWDTGALTFDSATPSDAWAKQPIALAKEASPGLLVAVWAEPGAMGIDASGETVIGTLTFAPSKGRAASLAFKVERSALVDHLGNDLHAQFAGGTVLPIAAP